jgi:predicted ferric reductase
MIVLTVFNKELGSKILFLNSSSAYLAHTPADVFSASTSLLNLISSLILFLSIAAFSLLSLAFVSSSRAGSFSKSSNGLLCYCLLASSM